MAVSAIPTLVNNASSNTIIGGGGSTSVMAALGQQIEQGVTILGSLLTPVSDAWDLSKIPVNKIPASFNSLEIKGIPMSSTEVPYVTYISGQLTALYGNAKSDYLTSLAVGRTVVVDTAAPRLAPPVCTGVVILDLYERLDLVLSGMGLPLNTPNSQIRIDDGTKYCALQQDLPSTTCYYFAASYITSQGETVLSPVLAVGPVISFTSIYLDVLLPIPAAAISINYYVNIMVQNYPLSFESGGSDLVRVGSSVADIQKIIGGSTSNIADPNGVSFTVADLAAANQPPFTSFSGVAVAQMLQTYSSYYLINNVGL